MKLIYLTGIDGCGKTTHAKLLVNGLQRKGIDAKYLWLRWEPSFRRIIKAFRSVKESGLTHEGQRSDEESFKQQTWLDFKRRILTNPVIRQLWLYCASYDYYRSYKRSFKKLSPDIIVIDRYLADFIIDQAVNLGIAPADTALISKNTFLKKFHSPDLNIIIDLPAQEGYRRKNDGTPLSYLEIREKYYLSMNGKDTLHFDGLNSIDELSSQITESVIDKIEFV